MSAQPITVVSVDRGPLQPAAVQAVREATLLIGDERHAQSLPDELDLPRRPIGELAELVQDLRNHDGPAVVLAGSDPDFFGIVRGLRAGGLAPTVLPAPTLVQRLCATIGRPWDDVAVVDGARLRAAVNVCRARPAVAVLTAPDAGPAELGKALHGWPRTLVVAEDLGGPAERLSTVDAERAAATRWRDPDVVLCLREGEAAPAVPGWYAGGEPTPPATGWGLPDTQFLQRDGRLLGAEVRAVALSRLAPRPGRLVWDVGAGSGAIGIECARMGAAVLAVERDPGQCVRIIANAAAHEVEVCVVEDEAPGAFAVLPDPDAIFVGGGGPDVVAACATTGASRIVVARSALDGFAECRDALRNNGFSVDGCHLSVSRFSDSGGRARLTSTSPVLLLCGRRPDPARQ
jgi:precorrin-6B C5,15-methyltransferase / cobalt-precorrin-6B C5,C15-methyltransferase